MGSPVTDTRWYRGPLPPGFSAVSTPVQPTTEARSRQGTGSSKSDANLVGLVPRLRRADSGATLRVRLFGGFEIKRAGAPIPSAEYRGPLTRTLLRRLLAERGRYVSAEALSGALWPSRAPRDPLNSLRVCVHRARRALRLPDLIRSVDGGYVFIEDDRCTVDLDEFVSFVHEGCAQIDRRLLETGLMSLMSALHVWQGEPLAQDAPAPWAQTRRQDLIWLRQQAAGGAAHVAATIGHPMALSLAAEATASDPLSEAANLLLVRSLAQSGNPARALHAFEAFRRRLADDLGTDPSAEAQAIQMSLLRGERLPLLPAIPGLTKGTIRRLSPFALATFLGS